MQRNWNTTHWAPLQGGPAQMWASSTLSQRSQAGTALSSSAIGPKVFTAPTRAPALQGRAHVLFLKKKQKFNVVMMCQSIQPQMLCETLNWITHPLGKLISKWTTKENCPPMSTVRDSTPRLIILGFKAWEFQGRKLWTRRLLGFTSHTQSCTSSLRAHSISDSAGSWSLGQQ